MADKPIRPIRPIESISADRRGTETAKHDEKVARYDKYSFSEKFGMVSKQSKVLRTKTKEIRKD